ncbi:unnamed protein product [Fraxinus pennsylvanica]|uniref:MYB-CC type transcription factor LHEQLE-containing domain-containing protein n=1 Tax=Fraxinus pennsylvanica TaxID=56036 RepID=A0AAD2A0E6_9LAMI|nr:unnamed protein product [Fraxinus pennsylvanica]
MEAKPSLSIQRSGPRQLSNFGVSGTMSSSFPVQQIQRNLLLRIEEQRHHLQMMFEKQCKSGMNMLKGTSSATENSLKEFIDSVGNALSKSDSGVPVDSRETGRKSSNVPERENSRDVGEKHKAH